MILLNFRIVHQSVALRISKDLGEPENARWLSQADLALTIVGISGSILISPKSYGISDHSQLEGLFENKMKTSKICLFFRLYPLLACFGLSSWNQR